MHQSNDQKLHVEFLLRPYQRNDGLAGLLALCARLGHLISRLRGICNLQLPHPITIELRQSLQYDSPVRTHRALRTHNVNPVLSVGSLECLLPSIGKIKIV
jgi:hypothetical protein